MNRVFADTFYWVALAHPRDRWHQHVMSLKRPLRFGHLLTTDEVLVEFLTYCGSLGPWHRSKAASLVRDVLKDATIDVVPQTHDSFVAGLTLYERRLDKGYSLTDCISMNTMNEYGVTEVLTHDEHFVQEGFRALFRT